MAVHDFRLIDWIEPEILLDLQKRVSASSNILAVILDEEGNSVADLACAPGLCERRDLTGGNTCREIHGRLYKKAKEHGRLQLDVCQYSKLSAAALPVFAENRLICVWILCRFIYSDKTCGQDSVRHEAGDVAVLSRTALELLSNFITLLTEEVFQLKYANFQLSQMEEHAKVLAYYDRLLYMPNMLSLEKDITENCQFKNLVILDIQDLRKINDVHGRDFGDHLLMAVRDFLFELKIPHARIYRLDASDFGILLPKQEVADLRGLAGAIQERCAMPWRLRCGGEGPEHNIYITLNMGVLPVNDDTENAFQNLTSAIEHTLDMAKKIDDIALFDDTENKSFRNMIKLELCLRQSVWENMQGFYVVYQPIIDPGVAVWRGVEALCRWKNEEFGLVSPGDFIPIAESTGLIHNIGEWVLEEAIAQIKQWHLDQVDNFVLDVNLSPVQLLVADIDKKVLAVLEKYQYPPEKLCLEITESNEMNFAKHTMEALERLSQIGVVIALDDFGTGYASFHSLHKLPIKLLKTDRSLIHDLENDSFLQRMFYVMAEMAHASDMKIVAEGIETDGQAQLLLKEGADFFQGFKFSHPLTVQDMAGKLVNFHNPSGDLVAMGYHRIDLSRLSDDSGGYELSSVLSRLLSRCMRVLFTLDDGNEAIHVALQYIGQELKVSRSYVFLKEKDGTFSNTHEWCAAGILPQKDSLQHSDIPTISPGWIEALERDGMLVAADIRTLEQGTFQVLSSQGIKAVIEFPIWMDEKLYGFVGFDDCEAVHHWTKEEIQMLHTLTSIISSTLYKMGLQAQLAKQTDRMKSMLDQMETFIYVSDMETDEILFINTELEKRYGHQNLIGEKCYAVFRHQKQRCSFCAKKWLMDNPGKSFQWEHYNEDLNLHLRIQDRIIPWDEDKMAHMQYALNITELKEHQIQLEAYASMDMLAKTMNRSGFMQSAKNSLKKAYLDNQVVTIVFLDIDMLKQENDLYGHSAGDQLICATAQALKESVRETDMIGRFGGDEFVILLYGCAKENAERIVQKALTILKKTAAHYSFSWGLAENSEIAYISSSDYLDQLINVADIRMIENKKQKRVHRLSNKEDGN